MPRRFFDDTPHGRQFCPPLTQAEPKQSRRSATLLEKNNRVAPALSRALPADVKTVPPVDLKQPVDPLRDSSAETWGRWSRDKEIREAVERRAEDLQNRDMATRAIYPRECAAKLANELKYVAPDWRTARPTLGPAWGQLLKQQPELAPALTRRREQIIATLFNTLPSEYHAAIFDLRKLIDLMLEAHEAAAYLVGFESGRLAEQTYLRRALPQVTTSGHDRKFGHDRSSIKSPARLTSSSLRLTMGGEE